MEEKIKALKEKLQCMATGELLGMIGVHFISFSNGVDDFAEQSDIFNKTKLISPQKQYTYLAGLLMSTDDKSDGDIIDDIGKYDDLENDVQEITLEYATGLLTFGIGMTLRYGNREYYFKKLEEHFPELKKEYMRKYGSSYGIKSPNSQKLTRIIKKFCKDNNIIYGEKEVFKFCTLFPEQNNQLSIFDGNH